MADNFLATTSVDANTIRIYQRNGSIWSLLQTISDPNTDVSSSFGKQVVMKAYNGKVYLYAFDRSATNPLALYYLYDSANSNPSFALQAAFTLDSSCASTVSISADIVPTTNNVAQQPILAVGCSSYSSSTGRAWIYRGTSTTASQTISPSTATSGDQFGYSVSLK